MRPRTIEEIIGQRHLLGEGKILDRLLHHRRLQSFIFWGPPGCGKTTLAQIIATHTDASLIHLSAVMAGTKEIRSAVEEAGRVWTSEHRRTWLFMDEIHRLNKAQQDTLLPHVERGTFLLLGATTENPSFEVIRPLLSRAQVLVLEPLGEEELRILIHRALEDKDRGLGGYPARLTEDAEAYLAAASGGDARVCLNGLEAAVLTTAPGPDGVRVVGFDEMQEALQRLPVHYDKGGEEHYNLISALHKSVRGSDPDAALYWLARMLEGGEDPLYLARRVIRMAVEDIGLADPFALAQANSAFETYQFLGSPEGELAIAQAVVYLALAPKSNSVYVAFGKAKELAKKTGSHPVPLHIRNAPTALLKKMGYGREYRYPHDDPSGWIADAYLPDSLAGTTFYNPTARGWEGKWKQLLMRRRQMVEAERKSPKQQSKLTRNTDHETK
jgi:putative ATPase